MTLDQSEQVSEAMSRDALYRYPHDQADPAVCTMYLGDSGNRKSNNTTAMQIKKGFSSSMQDLQISRYIRAA
ncbi:hypothetical protein KC352_g67 [Hortaea werneckii]|nr:hypothetical protein KC352_g67 [Hortaea werneckii]